MGRGERVARGYIGAVLMAQALVVAALSPADSSPPVVCLELAGAALLWVPLVFTFHHPVQVRALTAVPAVLASLWWAVLSAPVGIVAWGSWALAVAWLTFPADRHGVDTLAERRAHRRARTGAQPDDAHRPPA